MKPTRQNPFLRNFLAAATLGLGLGQSANAASVYWDTNAATAGSGAATGTWGTSTFWTATEAGTAATTGTLPTANDDVFIAAGTNGTTGTITINGAQVAGSVTIQEPAATPGVTISGGTSLTLGGGASASKGLFVTGNGAHTVSTPLILSGANTIQNAGTLTLTVSGGITGTGDLTLRNNNNGATGINLTTAAINNTGAISNAGNNTGFVILGNTSTGGAGTGSAGLGANVTSFSQDSTSSPLEFRNANNSAYTGDYDINAGTLHWGGTNTSGTITATNASSEINLGGTSGSANATLNVINNAVSGKLNNNIRVRAGSTGTKTIGVALTGSSVTFSTTGSITLDDNVNLQPNTSATLNPNGLIQDGSNGAKGITKVGPGTVNLNLAHTYSGATNVSAGSLVLTGASGSLPSTSGIALIGGTFQLNNTGAANNGDRIPNSTVVAMTGGTLDFKNDAAATTAYSETINLTAAAGGTITASQAAADGSSSLTIGTFTRNPGAALTFSGTGLGLDSRNQIFFTTPPTPVNGIIPWAAYGTTGFANYDGTNGIVAAAATDIDAQGSTIANDSTSNLRIFADGTGSAIALGAATTSINSLIQANTVVAPATIDTAGKTLRVNSVLLSSAANTKGLTIGSAEDDGTLTTGTAGGELLLINNSASALTVNAVIADNTTASSLTKAGTGDATFAGNNTYTGATYLAGGVVTAADDNAFGSGTININNPTKRLAVANGVTLSNPITFNGGGEGSRGVFENGGAGGNATIAGPITISGTLAGGGHFASNGTGGTLTISGPITSTGTSPVVRTGTVIFSGDGNDSSYSTFNASAGITRLGASDALLPTATLDMGTSGDSRLDLNGFNQTLAGITRSGNNTFIGNSSLTGDSTLTTTGTSSYSGSILNVLTPGTMKTFLVVDSGSLTLTGAFSAETATIKNTGTLVLGAGGGDTFAPPGKLITVENGGTLRFTGANRVQNDTVIDVKAGGTFDPNGQGDTIGYLKGAGSIVNLNTSLTLNMPLVGSGSEFSGSISGTGGITAAGAGTGAADTNVQILSGVNSFTGNVNVQRGLLRITNSSALGEAPVAGTKTIAITANSNKFLELDGTAGNITLPSTFLFSTSGVNGTIRNLAGDNTIEGAFSLTSGNGSTKIVSDAGSLTLNGNITTVGSAGANRTLDLDGTSTANNAVNGVISNGGGFQTSVTKNGSGKWILGGANLYTQPTLVNAGTLHLTGSIAAGSAVTVGGATATGTPTLTGAGGTVNGTLNIAAAGGGAAGTVNPGTVGTTGTLNAGATTIAGTFACDVNGASTDQLVVTGDLTLGGTLAVNEVAAGTPGTYVIASYTGTRSGTLGGTLPAGYSVNYDDANKEVELVIAATGGFASWITGTFANGTVPGGQQGVNDDPDGDGASNLVEFAFDGDPTTGANNGKIHAFTVDTDADGDSNAELVLTVAVRSAVGAFTGATSKSASVDGITYTIEGSTTLGSFPTQVNVVPTAVPPSPATLSSGYAWKSFNLEGSNGLAGKGFLRATVTTP